MSEPKLIKQQNLILNKDYSYYSLSDDASNFVLCADFVRRFFNRVPPTEIFVKAWDQPVEGSVKVEIRTYGYYINGVLQGAYIFPAGRDILKEMGGLLEFYLHIE